MPVPCRRPVLARMARQQPRRPQLVRIAQLLALRHASDTSQVLASSVILGSLSGSRSVIKRHQRPISQRPLDAALHRLMMHAQPLSHRKKRWLLAISQKHLRSLYPARRLGSRARNRHQPRDVLIRHRHLDRFLTPAQAIIPLLVQPISNEESTNILPVPWIRFRRCRFHGIDRLDWHNLGRILQRQIPAQRRAWALNRDRDPILSRGAGVGSSDCNHGTRNPESPKLQKRLGRSVPPSPLCIVCQPPRGRPLPRKRTSSAWLLRSVQCRQEETFDPFSSAANRYNLISKPPAGRAEIPIIAMGRIGAVGNQFFSFTY